MPSPSQFPREKLPPTIWNRIELEIAKREAEGRKIIALHVGDTHLPLPRPLIEPAPDEERLFGTMLNRYGDTFGERPLREQILEKVNRSGSLPAEGIDCIQVTNGATGGLYAAFSKLLEPGAEVLTMAPYWPILKLVAAQAGVRLIEVPFFDRMAGDAAFDPAEQLERYRTSKTGGIYLNTPSNPTGMVLERRHLERITEFARERDLWVFADEAYEDFIWEGPGHVSIGSLPGMWERTVTVFTFSKCFGASGVRIGYSVAPASVVSRLNHAVVASHYQVGRYDQLMAWRGMRRFDECLQPLRDDYIGTWEWTRRNLKCPTLPCAAGFYLFVELGSGWKGVPSDAKISRMLDGGVVLAPGEHFGDEYDGWARLCFTAQPPDAIREGIDRLNRLLG